MRRSANKVGRASARGAAAIAGAARRAAARGRARTRMGRRVEKGKGEFREVISHGFIDIGDRCCCQKQRFCRSIDEILMPRHAIFNMISILGFVI